jgi:hypothetical protein
LFYKKKKVLLHFTRAVLWHAFLFLGLSFFLPFFLFFAWWPPLLSLVRNFLQEKAVEATKQKKDCLPVPRA